MIPATLIYYYLLSKQYIITLYAKLYYYILNVEELKGVHGNTVYNLLFKYMIVRVLAKYNFTYLYDQFNSEYSLIHITKLTSDSKKSMILGNCQAHAQIHTQPEPESQIQLFNMGQLLSFIDTVEIYNVMPRVIVIAFDLIDPCISQDDHMQMDSDKVYSLKQFVPKYNDPEMNYENTLENILLFNDIQYGPHAYLYIKILKGRMIEKKINDQIYFQMHINKLLDLENINQIP